MRPPASTSTAAAATAAAATPCPGNYEHLRWGRGFEGQRKADLGDGTFLNPIFAGDHPDPTLLRDGDDYYLTFSSFDAYPGVVIWHSRDLVNWQPVGPALRTRDRLGLGAATCAGTRAATTSTFPRARAERRSIYVIQADDIRGPWSEPIDLGLPDHIDPGHVGRRGRRALPVPVSGGDRVRLTADGLACAGPVEHVYDPWRYPEDWDVESFSPEGPKIVRHGEWFYMVTAVGGTAGPPTGHMVIVARSRSIHGPWEDAPDQPDRAHADRATRSGGRAAMPRWSRARAGAGG